jgi:hypothetical protein
MANAVQFTVTLVLNTPAIAEFCVAKAKVDVDAGVVLA